jgi:signal transduction histidine kinase
MTIDTTNPVHGHRPWWPPLTFVIAALLLLLVTPIVIYHETARRRDEIQNGSDHGRLLINDLEAGFAHRLVEVRRDTLTPPVEVGGDVETDEAELAETMPRVGPEAVARFDSLHTLLDEWRRRPGTGIGDAATAARARRILDAGESLDTFLAARSVAQRAAVRRIQRLNIIVAVILAPIALAAILVVFQSGERLARYARDAERQRADVTRAAESRAALLRGVTHDVKNPLGAAVGYADLLHDGLVGSLTEQQTDMVRRIRRLVAQAVDTIGDLLELAHADSGLQIEYTHADLGTVAGEVVDDHRGMARERGLTLESAATPAAVVTDPRRARQVLANLVSNAIKYTPKGGVVRVGVVHDGGERVGVEVRDTGPGIPPELREKLFEEFFRVRSAPGAANGNGLGLAISRRIARLLGGDVSFSPNESGGSVFTLWLPSSEHRTPAIHGEPGAPSRS